MRYLLWLTALEAQSWQAVCVCSCVCRHAIDLSDSGEFGGHYQVPSSIALYFSCWDTVSYWTQSSPSWLDWLVSQPQDSSCLCLCLPSAGNAGMYLCVCLYCYHACIYSFILWGYVHPHKRRPSAFMASMLQSKPLTSFLYLGGSRSSTCSPD